jgi:hypothetical protein
MEMQHPLQAVGCLWRGFPDVLLMNFNCCASDKWTRIFTTPYGAEVTGPYT